MLRFVKGPDDILVFDLKGKLPGRGVWVSAGRAHLERAVAKGLFKRAFDGAVTVPADLVDQVAAQLRTAALQALSMAKKAGLVITGFNGVDTAIRGGKALAVVHAADGAEDGRRKLANAIHAAGPEGGPVATLIIFTANELSLALGGANVVHAAAMVGPASTMFVMKARRAAGFCADTAQGRTGDGGSTTVDLVPDAML